MVKVKIYKLNDTMCAMQACMVSPKCEIVAMNSWLHQEPSLLNALQQWGWTGWEGGERKIRGGPRKGVKG